MQPHFVSIIVAAFCLGEVICRSFTSEEGQYNVIIYNTSNCLTAQTWFHTNVTAYTSKGKSLLRGTVTTKRETKNVKFRIQIDYMDHAKVKIFEVKNLNCQNMIIRLVLTTIGLPYNLQKCTMKPTTIDFDNLNLDAIFHKMVQSLWYGSMKVRWEIAVPSTMVMCLDIHVQTVKA